MINALTANNLSENALQTRFPLLQQLTEIIVKACNEGRRDQWFLIKPEWTERTETIRQVFEDHGYHISYGTLNGKQHMIVSW